MSEFLKIQYAELEKIRSAWSAIVSTNEALWQRQKALVADSAGSQDVADLLFLDYQKSLIELSRIEIELIQARGVGNGK